LARLADVDVMAANVAAEICGMQSAAAQLQQEHQAALQHLQQQHALLSAAQQSQHACQHALQQQDETPSPAPWSIALETPVLCSRIFKKN
jgi:hypothetical protein